MLKFLRRDLLFVLALAAVFLSLSYAINYVSDSKPQAAELQPSFLSGERAPRAQQAAGRVWKEQAFEKTLALGAGAVADPLTVRVGTDGHIYVLDYGDFRIKMFSPAGKLVRAFGAGRGTEAGAFTSPTGFSVRPGGDLWVCDPGQRRITQFGPDGQVRAVLPQSPTDRLATVGDLLVTMAPPGADALFEVYSLSGERLNSFGEVVADQQREWIALDGTVAGDEEGRGFVYGGRYLGVLAGYGTGGERRFIVQTIDGAARPKVLDIEGKRKIRTDATQAVLSLSVVGDELYVLSGAAGGEVGQVLDVYDKRDGGYRFSLKLPVAARQAVVRAGHVYAVGGGGVTVWRFGQGA